LAAEAPTASTASSKTFSIKELRADFEYFYGTPYSRNPLVNADKAALVACIDAQRSLLRGGMDVLDFSRLLMPIFAKVGCGHTSVNLPPQAI
jgi:hypothetical protein